VFTILDAIKNVNQQCSSIFPQSLPKYHSINRKTQFLPGLYIPENVLPSSILARSQLDPSSIPAQPTRKRLSSSRNSTALPPHSLSNVNFALHRSVTHALIDSQQFNCLNTFHRLSSQFPLSSLLLVLAGYTLFIPARFCSLIRPHLAHLLITG